MAKIGLRYIVCAPLNKENQLARPTYGPGMVMGRGVAVDVTYTVSNAKMYADNMLVESDKSITGGSITMTLDDILPDARVMALGVKKVENDNGSTTYRTTGKPAGYIGLGYIEERKYDGVIKYLPTWVYKVAFAPADQQAKTREENVEFHPSSVKGEFMGLTIDESAEPTFADDKEFATSEEAVAWLNQMAGIVVPGAGG